jgi:hypothetical protein
MTTADMVQADSRRANANNELSLVSRLKGGGYLTSTASVLLLAVPGLKAALDEPLMGACLAAGVLTSIGGMFLRWRSHRLEQKEKGG